MSLTSTRLEAEVKKLNLHDIYSLGRELSAIRGIANEAKYGAMMFPLWDARERLTEMIGSSLLLSSSRRAADGLIKAISAVVPVDFNTAVTKNRDEEVNWFAHAIRSRVAELETVLGNDMPDIASYVVSQKGIYRTDDLIAHAEHQLSDEARKLISDQICHDIREAGRSLAYELPTACAFHLWRSVESAMGGYFQRLTGKTWRAAKVARNWSAYIKAMADAGTPNKITGYLDHIRAEYRNPQTHPDEPVTLAEAQRLFPVALSAVEQLVLEMNALPIPAPAPTASPPASTSAP